MPTISFRAANTSPDLAMPAPHSSPASTAERHHPGALPALLEHGHDPVLELDGAGTVLAWNGAAERLLGWNAGEAIGQNLGTLCMPAPLRASHDDTLRLYLECADDALLARRAEWLLYSRRGQDVAVEATMVALAGADGARFLAILHDIGERKLLLASLDMMALRDPLTRLPNRRALMQALPEAMQRADRLGRPLAVLLLNVRGLKQLNAEHGYDHGDALLTQFGARIVAGLRRTDTVARLAGDEFVAVLEMVGSTANAADSAAKLQQALLLPYVQDDGLAPLTVGAGIGLTLYTPDEGVDAAALLLRARVAPACRLG